MNDDNLIPMNQRTKSEQREISQNAGKKSGEARREKRRLREALETLLEKKDYTVKDKNGNRLANGYELLAVSMFRAASNGSVQAFKEIRDTIGEKPAERLEFEGTENQELLKKYLEGAKNGNFTKGQEEKN